jgi:hypothetical protein
MNYIVTLIFLGLPPPNIIANTMFCKLYMVANTLIHSREKKHVDG